MDKSLDLVGIVSQYVQLTPVSDSHYSGQCPFCSSGEDSLILSLSNQHWICLSCDADGDKYDFVAKSENIGRAEAILMVGHYANAGGFFPHARFKTDKHTTKEAATHQPEQTAAKTPAPSAAKTPETPAAANAPGSVQQTNAEKELLAPFLDFRNIISSYQGAAILDGESKMVACDNEYPNSTDLAGIAEILVPILEHAGTVFSKWGMSAVTVPATLTLASEDSAILIHKVAPADKLMLLAVRLANPSDVPVARRLVASASAKLA